MLSRTVESFDEMFDVIVVGYGFGGAVSALSAHDAGAEVLLAEKMPNPGGFRSVPAAVCGFRMIEMRRSNI